MVSFMSTLSRASRHVWFLFFAVLQLLACGSERNESDVRASSPADAGAERTDGAGVYQLLDEDSPLFLMVAGEAESGLGFLAAKDQEGNPYALTGVAFFEGEDFVSVELDALGRPSQILMPGVTRNFSGYTATSVTTETFLGDAEAVRERIELSPEVMEALRFELPSLFAIEKATSKTLLEQLAVFAHGVADALECGHALWELIKDIRGGRPPQRAETVADCLGFGASAASAISNFFGRHSELLTVLTTTTAVLECVADVGVVASTLSV
jgi:hypothetical protein